MGIFGNEYITESREKAEGNILSFVSLFYEHLAKWVFLPQKQSSSWIESLVKARNGFRHIRKDEKGYYNSYNIENNKEDIIKATITRLKKDNSMEIINSMDFDQLLQDFPTMNSMLDNEYLKKYLYKYKYIQYIDIEKELKDVNMK